MTIPPTRARARTIAVAGLRVTDGRGRGIQQIEKTPWSMNSDPSAETVIPAGRWEVSYDVIAGSTAEPGPVATLFYADAVTTKLIEDASGNFVPERTHTEALSLRPRTRERVRTRFDFLPGETYQIRADVTSTSGDNDTSANNRLVAKFRVVDCDDEAHIPNALDPDGFCREGLPFDNSRFECWEGDSNTWGYGRCRECWEGSAAQPCEYGEFCVEGMCDDPETCWSGETRDQYEGAAGSEASPTSFLYGSKTVTRTLYDDGAQDKDTNQYLVPAVPDSIGYVLGLKVHNHCFDPAVDTDYFWMNEVSVRVWYRKDTLPKIRRYLVGSDTEWVTPNRWFGIIQPLDAEAMAAISNMQREVQVEIKNSDDPADRRNIAYTLEVKLKTDPYPDFSGGQVPDPGTVTLGVTDSAELTAQPGETRSFVLGQEVVERSGRVVLEPISPQEPFPMTTTVVLRDRFGQVSRGGQGVEYGDGMAVSLSGAILDNTPYTLFVTSESATLSSRVFACPSDVEDCVGYEPLLGTCGPNCQGDGVSCCADGAGSYECRYVRGDDEENCGGCGKTCEWDEICLDGVCAVGEGTSCWNTDCSEGTVCVSDDWLWRTDPSCKAIFVDPGYCGYWGEICGDNEICRAGLCLPRMLLPCDLECGHGESCCWVMGQEECLDVESDNFNCGGCGNVCPAGTVCSDGLCEEWYIVFDVCPPGWINCGTSGPECVDSKNDFYNCGGCGTICPDSAVCQNGDCVVEVEDVNYDE